MGASSRTESVAGIAEQRLEYRCQLHGDCLLYRSVNRSGYSQLSFLSVVLGYLYSADWSGTVLPFHDRLSDRCSVFHEVLIQFLYRHSIDAR